jgi:hypothetical protein
VKRIFLDKKIGAEMKKRFDDCKEIDRKKLEIPIKLVSSFLVVILFFFLQGCKSVSNGSFQLNQAIENQGFTLPYISIENNQLCIRDANQHETLVLESLPTKAATSTKPIFRQDAMYFGIWDQDKNSSWSSVWKYQIDTGDMVLVWESTKEDCKLLNIDPSDTIFCLQKMDSENPALYFYHVLSSTTQEAVLDENRIMDLCYFGQDSSSVILGQSIEEDAAGHYFFFIWSLDSTDRIYEIGRGMQPVMNEYGTVFSYRIQNPPSLVFYSLESKERISFRQQTNTIQWDFWTDHTFFLAEKYTTEDTTPRFYRLNMRGEKEALSMPISQDESEIWYVGIDQECPVVYVQSDTMSGFMKFLDTGKWQRYGPLAEFTCETPITYVSEFVPVFQRYHSPHTLGCIPGQYLAFFVETQESDSSIENQDLKTIQYTIFNPSKATSAGDDNDFKLVQYTMKDFYHSMEESKFTISPYKYGDLYNIMFYAKEKSDEHRPILISLSDGDSQKHFEDMIVFTSLVYTEDKVPILQSISMDPSKNFAYGQIHFVDSYGDPISMQTQDVLLPLHKNESIEWNDLILLTEANIQFITWVIPIEK